MYLISISVFFQKNSKVHLLIQDSLRKNRLNRVQLLSKVLFVWLRVYFWMNSIVLVSLIRCYPYSITLFTCDSN